MMRSLHKADGVCKAPAAAQRRGATQKVKRRMLMFISKPIDITRFAATVRDCLQRQVPAAGPAPAA